MNGFKHSKPLKFNNNNFRGIKTDLKVHHSLLSIKTIIELQQLLILMFLESYNINLELSLQMKDKKYLWKCKNNFHR